MTPVWAMKYYGKNTFSEEPNKFHWVLFGVTRE